MQKNKKEIGHLILTLVFTLITFIPIVLMVTNILTFIPLYLLYFSLALIFGIFQIVKIIKRGISSENWNKNEIYYTGGVYALTLALPGLIRRIKEKRLMFLPMVGAAVFLIFFFLFKIAKKRK